MVFLCLRGIVGSIRTAAVLYLAEPIVIASSCAPSF